MSRIDNYVWPSYGNVTPQAPFGATFGQKLLDAFNIRKISAEEINLTPELLGRRI